MAQILAMLVVFVGTMFVSTASAASCAWAAPDWTGRVWSRDTTCNVKNGNGVTEIYVGGSGEIWRIIGKVGQRIIPGVSWVPGFGWARDESRDRVIWTGAAAPAAGPCPADGRVVSGWDFASGFRICVPSSGR